MEKTNILKNKHLLEGIISETDLDMMEHAARSHKQFGNVTFKIIDINESKVTFSVAQGKSSAGHYHGKDRLIEIVHETFGRFFSDRKIVAGPLPYEQPACNQVTGEWILAQMKKHKIRLNAIAEEVGIDYKGLSKLTTGAAPISQIMKAFFWFYFLAKENVNRS